MKLCKDCNKFNKGTNECKKTYESVVTGKMLKNVDATKARELWCGIGAKYFEKKLIRPCDFCGKEAGEAHLAFLYIGAFGKNIVCQTCSNRPAKESDLLAQGFYMGKGSK